MKNSLKIATCYLILLASCSTTNDVTLLNISGTANYIPLLMPGSDPLPLAALSITAKNATQSYTLTTDSKGKFALPGNDDEPVTLTAKQSFTDANQFQAIYTVSKVVTTQADGLNVMLTATADTKTYNGVLLTIVDTDGGSIPGAKVVGYSSSALANADVDFSGFGALFSLTSNASGKCLAMQLPTIIYVKAIFNATSTNATVNLKSSPLKIDLTTFQTTNLTIQ